MKSLLTDIGLTILLTSAILWLQLRPPDPLELSFVNQNNEPIKITKSCMILFWDIEVKASHRDIQLLHRFQQAHPEIDTYFVHPNSISNEELGNFLISLGVYTTPVYSETWPSRIPTNILLHNGQRTDLSHSPTYSELMEFFEVEF